MRPAERASTGAVTFLVITVPRGGREKGVGRRARTRRRVEGAITHGADTVQPG